MAAPFGNLFALGNNGGHEPFFKTPKELQAKVNEYLKYCEVETLPLTITGLALFLGFMDRHSLYDYEKKKEFTTIIKKARTLVENGYENRLHSDKNNSGAIFALKNMNWTDKQTTVHEIPEAATFTITYRNGDSVNESSEV